MLRLFPPYHIIIIIFAGLFLELLLLSNHVGCYIYLWAEILAGYKAVSVPSEEDKKSQRSLYAQLEAVADMKFTYVATCQIYGNQKRSGDRRATDILNLLVKYVLIWQTAFYLFWISCCWVGLIEDFDTVYLWYSNPSLRVAYIDEVEETENGTGKVQKVYYSVLIKAVDDMDQVCILWTLNRIKMFLYCDTKHWQFGVFEQEIYRIKLPGAVKIGEGKPENQNHAIIFTRGEALQAIDMNQVTIR